MPNLLPTSASSPTRAISVRRSAAAALAVAGLLVGPLGSGALADTGSFTDPRDADAAVVDITDFSLTLDGSSVTGTVTLAQWDLAVVQSATLLLSLDTTGDGAADYSLHKGSGGQAAEVERGEFGDHLCDAATDFNGNTRSISLTAPASCLGDPSFARVKVYFSALEGADFAPSTERFTSEVLRTGAQPPAPRTPATISCPGGGTTFTDPSETTDADSDITSYRLAYDGNTVCTVVSLRGFDLAGAQAGILVSSLDSNGDGAADFSLVKGNQGETAVVRKQQFGNEVCPASASFDNAARTVTLSAPASCIGSPASVRLSLYLSFDDADFAPGVDRYTDAVTPTTKPNPSPTSSAPSSPSPTSGPTPSPTQPSTPRAAEAPTVTLSPTVISAGQVLTATYRGTPNTTLRVLSKTQPATAYSQITAVALDSNGLATTTHRPQRNTRLMATTSAGAESLQPLVQVRSVASMNAQRTSGRIHRFTGRVYPAREGRLVSLYRSGVLAAQGRTDATGVYVILRALPPGSASYNVKTGDDTYNLGTTSRPLSLRS